MTDEAMEVRDASAGYAPQVDRPMVPEGYKQTEVGVIPQDWEVVPLGSIGDVLIGLTYKPSDVRQHGTLVLRSSNIQNHTLEFEDNVFVDMDIPEHLMVRPGDILVCVRNGSRSLIGKSVMLDERATGMTFGAFMSIYRSQAGRLVSFLFQSDVVSRQINEHLGATINQITSKSLNSFLVPLSTNKSEQHAIATALSDVDALLESLDCLIAKKRDIKQATMQQLLTGETRLPGFEGERRSVRLGDHVTFLKNGTHSRAELVDSGEVRYLHYGDIHAADSATLDPAALPFLPPDKAKSLSRLNEGDVIFADASEDIEGVGSSVELVNVGDTEVVAGLHTIAARFDKSVLADGFKAYLQFCPEFISALRRLAAGTKVYATTRSHISGTEMRLPDVEEQRAIAATLKDMDVELDALEQRRAKTAALKQAMMQELLTGRTRLI
jgi:type I restriction enzyme S subunit